MLYFVEDVYYAAQLCRAVVLVLLFVDCLVESRRMPRFACVASRRWVALLTLKPSTVFFFLFYETDVIS